MAKTLYLDTAGSDDPIRAGLPLNFALGAVMPVAIPSLKENVFAGKVAAADKVVSL